MELFILCIQATSFQTNSPVAWDDIRFSKTQMQFILNHFGLFQNSAPMRRNKRKISNFETFPAQMWSMPIKYKIDPNIFSGNLKLQIYSYNNIVIVIIIFIVVVIIIITDLILLLLSLLVYRAK